MLLPAVPYNYFLKVFLYWAYQQSLDRMSHLALYCCDKGHDKKQHGEEKIYFSLRLYSIKKVSQGRNARQNPGSRNWSRGHQGMLLTGLLSMAHSSCFLYTTQDHLPTSRTNNGLDPSTSIVKQENVWWLPIGQSDGGTFSIVFLHTQL